MTALAHVTGRAEGLDRRPGRWRSGAGGGSRRASDPGRAQGAGGPLLRPGPRPWRGRALDELLTVDFRSWLPDGGSVGPGPYRDAVLASRQAFPDLRVTVLDQVAEGDKVATRWQAQGTHGGRFAGVPATGRPVTISAIHVHRVAGGRLAEHWEAINLLPLLGQLGALG